MTSIADSRIIQEIESPCDIYHREIYQGFLTPLTSKK